jgi:hypothetical protein
VNENLEKETREVLGVLKRKDGAEYVSLSKVVLKVNKILAVCVLLYIRKIVLITGKNKDKKIPNITASLQTK